MNGKRHNNTHRYMHCGRVLFIVIVTLGAAMIPASQASAQATALDNALEEAILAENWEVVLRLLPAEAEPNLPAALRLVKGHACLATNRNNESLCLFLSATSKEDLQKWQTWSQNFAAKYPTSPIAHYFKGDSYARLEQWDQAISDFNTALKIDPNHPLVLNARGVTYCAKGAWDSALIDLTAATISGASFADVYASTGAMWIQRRLGPLGASMAFEKALELSPSFALAHNGKGCAEFALGRWTEANHSIAKAHTYLSCDNRIMSVISHNLSVIAVAAKRAQFPFFSKFDLADWSALMTAIRDPESILHKYFRDMDLPKEVDEAVVSVFNKILEIPYFYDENRDKVLLPEQSEDIKPGVRQMLALIVETRSSRCRDFLMMKESEKEKIRKLNRLLLEYCFPKDLIQLAMSQIDAPGFSLERDAGYVNSWNHKNQLPNIDLANGLNRMETLWRPMADSVAAIPIVGGALSNNWNRHLDNQIGINKDILSSRGVPDVHSGGVDFSMRRAHIDEGDWGVGTWFSLAYHVAPARRQVEE